MIGNRPELNKDDDFQNQWLNQSQASPVASEKKVSPIRRNFEDIKKYAYEAFDKLDKNGNGFIETDELYAAMQDEATPMKDKSYIMFLLTNQSDIANAAQEGEQQDGISRVDLELYFRLVLARI